MNDSTASEPTAASTSTDSLARVSQLSWLSVAVAVAGLAVVTSALANHWGGVSHGHPAYAVLLVITVVGCVLAIVLAFRGRRRDSGRWRRVGRVLLLVLGAGWIALIAWLQPYLAVEPALAAMESDAVVSVTETPTEIALVPTGGASETGVFFQPGALVDARAYVAVLRPLAEAGFTVVIPKQPLSIAFLALGAFDGASAAHPEISEWVLGGHSLGGTVAAIEANTAAVADPASIAGLLFFASYPADDMSDADFSVLSISGTEDALATPEKIEASRATVPTSAEFVVIDGASHAQFGSYGLQSGDGTATISNDDAREQISGVALEFVESLTR